MPIARRARAGRTAALRRRPGRRPAPAAAHRPAPARREAADVQQSAPRRADQSAVVQGRGQWPDPAGRRGDRCPDRLGKGVPFMVRPAHALNRLVLAAAAGLLLLPAGCIGLSKHRRGEDGKPVPAGPPPAEMLVTWNKSVQFGTNPVNNSPMAAVTASVFLFPKIEKDGERNEKSGHAIEANDGKMIVELFDDSATGQPAKLLERWELTPDGIDRYLRHDAMLGAYYGVALPWPSYTPDISRIHM